MPVPLGACGDKSGHIAPRVARSYAVHAATHRGPAARTPLLLQRCAQPVAHGAPSQGRRPRLPQWLAPINHHPERRAHHRGEPVRSHDTIAAQCLVRRGPQAARVSPPCAGITTLDTRPKLLLYQDTGGIVREAYRRSTDHAHTRVCCYIGAPCRGLHGWYDERTRQVTPAWASLLGRHGVMRHRIIMRLSRWSGCCTALWRRLVLRCSADDLASPPPCNVLLLHHGVTVLLTRCTTCGRHGVRWGDHGLMP
jgi:hypothetical protein